MKTISTNDFKQFNLNWTKLKGKSV